MTFTDTTYTPSTRARIETFTDWFIRSEHSQIWGQSSDDWINDPERAERCLDAAEVGADGSTHREHIQDWRDAFKYWIQDRRRGRWTTPDRFIAAVEAYFDQVEQWHETNGSLDEEIG
jgi:hypothetical protein